MPAPDLTPLWSRALELEIGLAVKTTNKKSTLVELYKCRQEANNPELEKLVIMNPDGDELFIMKKEVELD